MRKNQIDEPGILFISFINKIVINVTILLSNELVNKIKILRLTKILDFDLKLSTNL